MNDFVIVILGMHRSGTSCLTGLLQQAGVELGDVVKASPYNNKGNQENPEIMTLNNTVLSHNNGSWDAPPQNPTWTKAHQQERDKIIQLYADKGVWGFKDPRTLIMLPFWLEGLGQLTVRYIGTFRHPLSVAKSLNARQPDFPLKKGIELWRIYNEKLLEYQQQYQFPLVDFDLEPTKYLRSVVDAICDLKVLPNPHAKILNFFNEALLHQKGCNDRELQEYVHLLGPVMPLYKKLKAIK